MSTRSRARFLVKQLENLEPWTGPVTRLGDLSAEERARLGIPAVERRKSTIAFWRCANPHCAQFTPRGSRAAGKCLICFTPKPDGA